MNLVRFRRKRTSPICEYTPWSSASRRRIVLHAFNPGDRRFTIAQNRQMGRTSMYTRLSALLASGIAVMLLAGPHAQAQSQAQSPGAGA